MHSDRSQTTIAWFRQDLRIDDNPAFIAAARRAANVIPLYIQDPDGEGDWPPGAASRWWLHQSLLSLDRELRGHGSRLIVRQGPSVQVQ
jgi:deoxyribodipyrimidine photo-lyase